MSADKRAYPRLLTRAEALLLHDGRPADCLLRDLSAIGAQVIVAERPAVGARAVLFADEFGRFDTRIVRHTGIGVALQLEHRPGRLERTLERIADYSSRLLAGGLPQGSSSTRVLLEALVIAGEIAGSRAEANRSFWQVVERCAARGWVTVRPVGAGFWAVAVTDAGRRALG